MLTEMVADALTSDVSTAICGRKQRDNQVS